MPAWPPPGDEEEGEKKSRSKVLDIAVLGKRWEHADLLLPLWPLEESERAIEHARRHGAEDQLPRARARLEAEAIRNAMPAILPAGAQTDGANAKKAENQVSPEPAGTRPAGKAVRL